MNIIETHSLSKFYGKERGITDVTISVKQGEIFGFIGPNGAGKSTTIRTLLGLLAPSSGEAKLFGQNILENGHELRRRIGYLPSEVNYYAEMSSWELLDYHSKIYALKDATAKIKELAEYFELDIERPIADLSFGNKKKCAIIQALVHDPELLILDEPTSGLDPLMQNRFFDLLESKKAKGTTVFFSSHILSEVQRLCDRAAIIRGGEISAVEDISSLLAKQMKKVRLVLESESKIDLPEGSKNGHWAGNKVFFDYVGPTQDLITWLGKQRVVDLTLSEPDLESIFMNYYRR
jgi:ABC-2 type transport system ATP-binding protein